LTTFVALVASVVVVLAELTTMLAGALALALWLALPPYSVRRLWLPNRLPLVRLAMDRP